MSNPELRKDFIELVKSKGNHQVLCNAGEVTIRGTSNTPTFYGGFFQKGQKAIEVRLFAKEVFFTIYDRASASKSTVRFSDKTVARNAFLDFFK